MWLFSVSGLCVTGALALLCVLAIPLWLIGIPGTTGTYEKTWMVGFFVLIAYPIAWGCMFTVWLIKRVFVNVWVGVGVVFLVIAAVGAVIYLFSRRSR